MNKSDGQVEIVKRDSTWQGLIESKHCLRAHSWIDLYCSAGSGHSSSWSCWVQCSCLSCWWYALSLRPDGLMNQDPRGHQRNSLGRLHALQDFPRWPRYCVQSRSMLVIIIRCTNRVLHQSGVTSILFKFDAREGWWVAWSKYMTAGKKCPVLWVVWM